MNSLHMNLMSPFLPKAIKTNTGLLGISLYRISVEEKSGWPWRQKLKWSGSINSNKLLLPINTLRFLKNWFVLLSNLPASSLDHSDASMWLFELLAETIWPCGNMPYRAYVYLPELPSIWLLSRYTCKLASEKKLDNGILPAAALLSAVMAVFPSAQVARARM